MARRGPALSTMDYVNIHEQPEGKARHLITSFKGWPDAGEGASSALRYLIRKLPARKFAELDSEDFYDFTQTRPQTSINSQGARVVRWPANELFMQSSADGSDGVMVFLGVEPNLKWRTFARSILDMAEISGVDSVIHVGSLLDAVPHTRAVQLTGSSNGADLKKSLEGNRIGTSSYQGPTGITSAFMEGCSQRGMSFASLWGHIPHYLQAAPNYRVGYALVDVLIKLLGVSIPLDELRSAASTFDDEVEKAVSKDSQISAYVGKLEQQYDEARSLIHGDGLQPDEVVKDLEQFLKEQRSGGEGFY